MPNPYSPSGSRLRAFPTAAAVLLLCAACTAVPLPPTASAPGASTSASMGSNSEPRAIQLGETVRGTLSADGDADDYPIRVERGQAFNAVLVVPAQRETSLRARIFHQHPVTGELQWESTTVVGSAEGRAGATKLSAPEEAGTYVVRVEGAESRYGGRYELRVLPTEKGAISLGQAIAGELDGRGDADDYVLTVPARTRFNAQLTVPFTGERRSLHVAVFRKDPVTGALDLAGSTLVSAESGRPGATRAVEALDGGTYVLRVREPEDRFGGTYELRAERL